MFVGGTLIRRFDGFRRLCRRSAVEFNHPLAVPDKDLLLCNRTLAALGGPPAPSEIRGSFEGDGLALLLLFLLTQEIPCRVGILGRTEPVTNKLKSLVHLFGHAAFPLISGEPGLQFGEVVRDFGPGGAVLRPCVRYDPEGEPLRIDRTGGAGVLRIGRDGAPFSLAILAGPSPGPAALVSPGGALHPCVLMLP